MSDYEFTDEMDEISGLGGSYEEGCRTLVVSGVEWLDDNPDADITFEKFEGVYGVIRGKTDDANEMLDHMMKQTPASPTGAMMQAAVNHVLFVRKNGWDGYVEHMEDRKDE